MKDITETQQLHHHLSALRSESGVMSCALQDNGDDGDGGGDGDDEDDERDEVSLLVSEGHCNELPQT